MKKSTIIFYILTLSASLCFAQKPTHTFVLGDSTFLLDGKPLQIISGEMHNTRVPREYWRARMKMAKAMGAEHHWYLCFLECAGTGAGKI